MHTCDFFGKDGLEHFALLDLIFATHCGGCDTELVGCWLVG